MQIRFGYRVEFEALEEVDLLVRLDVHPDQRGDITAPDEMQGGTGTGAAVDCSRVAKDGRGNLTRSIRMPAGRLWLAAEGDIFHSGFADMPERQQASRAPEPRPADALAFLLASRCCPTAGLTDQAWPLFKHFDTDLDRVEAICDYVHRKLRFAEDDPLAIRTAAEVLAAGAGSMRDFAHAAIAFCRCLDIPARYCFGYLPSDAGGRGLCEGSFCAWFEAYLDGGWWTFDAWHTDRRIGRVLVGRGLDAADVPIVAAPPACRVTRFECFAETVGGARYPATSEDRRDHWRALGAHSAS